MSSTIFDDFLLLFLGMGATARRTKRLQRFIRNEHIDTFIHAFPIAPTTLLLIPGTKQVALTRTHFKFGEEDMDYTTDHQMGFQYDPEKVRIHINWNFFYHRQEYGRMCSTCFLVRGFVAGSMNAVDRYY